MHVAREFLRLRLPRTDPVRSEEEIKAQGRLLYRP
jgi:hypothetical protein